MHFCNHHALFFCSITNIVFDQATLHAFRLLRKGIFRHTYRGEVHFLLLEDMSKRPHSDDLEDQSTAKRRDTRSTESFAVRPAQHYAGQCAIYKQPIEINSYSIDGERRVWFDDRELVRCALQHLVHDTNLIHHTLHFLLETIPFNTHRRVDTVPVYRV